MRYSAEEREAHVSLWRESGWSKARYCRESGVPYQSFVAWTRPGRSAGSDDATGFIQLADDRQLSRCAAGDLRVEVGAMALLFPGDADPDWVARVLFGLLSC